MFAQLPNAIDAKALQAFREVLARMDPEAEVFMDDQSGEVLVNGKFNVQQLSDAIERSGLGMRVVTGGGDGCCGGCGCA